MSSKTDKKIQHHGSIASYLTGFLLSVILTLVAYIPVVIHINTQHKFPSHTVIIPVILAFAVLQLFVQLVYFLHLGVDARNRWSLLFFISTVLIILIIVIGSIWIMANLNYNMLPQQVNT